MTIKWVKVDPLVMNGEPFCYGSRLTVRQLLELRRSQMDAAGRESARARGLRSLLRGRLSHA